MTIEVMRRREVIFVDLHDFILSLFHLYSMYRRYCITWGRRRAFTYNFFVSAWHGIMY